MPMPFDDRMPERTPLPRPGGWFEVFCCGGMLLLLVALIVALAFIR